MSENIIDSLNVLLEKIYSSVESNVYDLLDKLTTISPNILKQEPLKQIFKDDNGIIFVASSLFLFYILQYVIMKLVAMYNGKNPENIFKFTLRVILTIALISSSEYLCKTVLEINEMFTEIITSVGKNISKNEISFVGFSEVITDLEEYMEKDNLGIDGLIKGFISFGSITLLIQYSVRYVTIIFCILVMPFAIMLSITSTTRGVFHSWIKLCIVNLCQQWIVKLLLIIPLSFKNIDTDIFKVIVLGTIYLLYKINVFSKEFLGTISVGTRKGEY